MVRYYRVRDPQTGDEGEGYISCGFPSFNPTLVITTYEGKCIRRESEQLEFHVDRVPSYVKMIGTYSGDKPEYAWAERKAA